MSICLSPFGPSVRSDAALAAVHDTTVFTITPGRSDPVGRSGAAALNAGLLRSAPWSEAGQAGRLMRVALAERFGVSCYNGADPDAATRGTEPVQRGSARSARDRDRPHVAQNVDPVATIDLTTQATLVGPVSGARTATLFVTLDVLFDPAFRAVDPDALDGVDAVANFQDLVGISIAPLDAPEGSVRLLPEATVPRPGNASLRYAYDQTMDSRGRICVDEAGDAGLSPCAGGPLVLANRIASSAVGDDFDLALRLEGPGPRTIADRRRTQREAGSAGGGACWLSGLRVIGGLGAPMPYDAGWPGCLARASTRTPSLRRLPVEATSGIDLSYGAAFALDPTRLRGDVKIDLLAVQRMVSMKVRPGGDVHLSANLFIATSRIVLRCRDLRKPPEIAITRRRCWGTDLHRDADMLGSLTLPRPVAGDAWHA